MKTSHRRGLFLFRRDLRLADNTGLAFALARCHEVLPLFVLDVRQGPGHPYFSAHAFQFMLESLADLDAALRARGSRLHVVPGEPTEIVEAMITKARVDAVFVNRDYTPFSHARDGAILAMARRRGVSFESVDDVLLHAPDVVRTKAGEPYHVFTPYWQAARALPVRLPSGEPAGRLIRDDDLPRLMPLPAVAAPNEALDQRGGRARGLAALARIPAHRAYEQQRDLPAAEPGTTHLSAHLKFGTLSVREVHAAVTDALGAAHPLLRQLHWRDFYTQIGHHEPRVFGHPFDSRTARVPWPGTSRLLEAWTQARTGFPLVDAGMRQLRATGFMHNRVRMVVASFLTKDLHVDWRDGERWFARHLVDYDPALNNGNWQWAASTGCDAQPWFRVFNPWLQQRRFDPDAVYLTRWLPELADLPAARIHAIDRQGVPAGVDYPPPLVDHAREAKIAKQLFQSALERPPDESAIAPHPRSRPPT